MKVSTLLAMLLLASCVLSPARAADRALADGLAAAGIAQITKGNTAQAKDLFYKALAHDADCPDAIFELARLFDKENNTVSAGDFYQRAAILYAQESKPATAAKRTEAEKRVKALNPYAPRMSAIYEDYAQDLDKLVKKNTDTLTQDTALARVNELKLTSALPPEKLPKFYATAQAEKAERERKVAEADTAKKRSPSSSSSMTPRAPEKQVGVSAPDVEKELKAMGWTTVKGMFVKKGPGLYEATDARLEAPKVNGAIDFTIIKGSTGSVKATVRSDFNSEYSTLSDYYMQGYGFHYRNGKDYREYGAQEWGFTSSSGNSLDPSSLGVFKLADNLPKFHFQISVNEGELLFIVNDQRNNKNNNKKLPRTGPFIIDINGTVTIENPRCAGQ